MVKNWDVEGGPNTVVDGVHGDSDPDDSSFLALPGISSGFLPKLFV